MTSVIKYRKNFAQYKCFYNKAEDRAVASATAIDDNEAEEHLGKQKL